MKKLCLFLTLLSLAGMNMQAQTKPTLTFLPFTGVTSEDAQILMVLLANHEDIRGAFTVLPGAGNFSGILQEIQGAGLSPESRGLKSAFKTDAVITIHTKKMQDRGLVFISLVQAQTLQLLAGHYQRYNTIRDLRSLLPAIVKNLISSSIPKPDLPKLAVMQPFTSLDKEEAALLTMALAIDLAGRKEYALFPWDLSRVPAPSAAYSGIIDPSVIREMGRAANAGYILTADLLNMGTANLFRTGIVQTEDGDFVSEGGIEYRNLPEELGLVARLGAALMDVKQEAAPRRNPPARNLPALAPAPLTRLEPAKRVTPPDAAGKPPLSHVSQGAAPDAAQFARLEAGSFIMGSPLSEVSRDRDETPHQVGVNAFYLGKREVTQAEYEGVMGNNPSYFKGPDLPVEQVTWFDAVAYCNARSVKEGLAPVYTIHEQEIIWNHGADGYRLPTEAEWEYACRAGTATAYNLGGAITPAQGNYDGNYPYNKGPKGEYRQKTTPAGSFAPNLWGLFDMHGNVYEWCWDQYKPYSVGGLDGSMLADAVIRGGSWYSEGRFLRSANRVRASHEGRSYYIGFRVARSILSP
ncbi:MAG: formylglycine-generating enzyme family protein [Spirochaetaceae bacterium]|nr:formylglycine-generating enzyme family protein [Spirochaetaceae bacterium]